MHNLLYRSHTPCMNYVTNIFLLVSSSERSKQLLCFVHAQGQKTEQKHTTKNFNEFHYHSSLLTMDLALKFPLQPRPMKLTVSQCRKGSGFQNGSWRCQESRNPSSSGNSCFSSGEEFSSTKSKQTEVGEAMRSSSKQNKNKDLRYSWSDVIRH